MRKTRKGGYDSAGPPPNQLTPAKLREITEHLRPAQGKGELQNVMSDLSEVRKNDPEIFADRGEDKGDPGYVLDAVIRYKDDPDIDPAYLKEDLETVIDMLAEALDERPPRGARRGRKTRKGGRNQRPVIPREGRCYEGKTFDDPENYGYLGMYSANQNREVGLERQPAGFNWVRSWFTVNGVDERKLYIFGTLNEVDCQDGGARRGRKSRRKTLRQRK
jgi:hypothetical protein